MGKASKRKHSAGRPAPPEGPKWEGPDFKGFVGAGAWRECDALITAREKNSSSVIEESSLCTETGLLQECVEQWLADHWREHNFDAVLHGLEECADRTLSLIRDRGHYFILRLFSPNEPTPPEITNFLIRTHAQPVRLT